MDKLQHEMYWNHYILLLSQVSDWDKLQHEMYWNSNGWMNTILFDYDKLQHEMYWNSNLSCVRPVWLLDKLQHEMYWNGSRVNYTIPCIKINYNMRCIEILLDVNEDVAGHMINYNMRCIEILKFKLLFEFQRDKLQHEMYWNINIVLSTVRFSEYLNKSLSLKY